MAADFHIHVITKNFTEDDVKFLKSNTLGSKYFAGFDQRYSYEELNSILARAENTPNIWIGEVSWLKASLSEDPSEYIPTLVEVLYDLVGEDFTTITPEFIDQVSAAFDTEEISSYYDSFEKDRLINFLNKYMGEKVFHVSW